MLIFRYLVKEVFITLAALTTILLFIFMSNQFVVYLNRAANGKIPAILLFKIMMLELPTLLGLLLPLGFYMAILLAYGRLYAESEMTVLQACGYGPRKLLQHSFSMAAIVALLVFIIMIWASPYVATARAQLLRSTGIQTIIQSIVPGRFNAISGGKQIFYVSSMSRDHKIAKNVFLARQENKNGVLQWNVLWAASAEATTDLNTNEDYVILKDGKEYEGIPGHADYQVAEFKQFKARLPHPTVEIKGDIRTYSTMSLWPINNKDLAKAAELQWRLSIPIMVLTMTLFAVPLSRVNPRAGKYAKLLPALGLYFIYANFMFVARDWFIKGKTPEWMGIWWLHIIALLIGLFLLRRSQVKFS